MSGETFLGVSGQDTATPAGTEDVIVTIDLPEHTHDEIVKMVVNILLENIEQPRYQSHSIEMTKVE